MSSRSSGSPMAGAVRALPQESKGPSSRSSSRVVKLVDGAHIRRLPLDQAESLDFTRFRAAVLKVCGAAHSDTLQLAFQVPVIQ